MDTLAVNLGLIAIIIFQQCFYLKQIQKLVDKLMSRSYMEYQQTNQPVVTREVPQETPPLPEDLRTLQPFTVPY